MIWEAVDPMTGVAITRTYGLMTPFDTKMKEVLEAYAACCRCCRSLLLENVKAADVLRTATEIFGKEGLTKVPDIFDCGIDAFGRYGRVYGGSYKGGSGLRFLRVSCRLDDNSYVAYGDSTFGETLLGEMLPSPAPSLAFWHAQTEKARSLEIQNGLETALGLKLDWGRSVALGHRKDVRVYLDPPEQPPDPLDLGEERVAISVSPSTLSTWRNQLAPPVHVGVSTGDELWWLPLQGSAVVVAAPAAPIAPALRTQKQLLACGSVEAGFNALKSRLAVRVALERPAEAFEGGQTEGLTAFKNRLAVRVALERLAEAPAEAFEGGQTEGLTAFKNRLAVRVALERPAEAFEGGETVGLTAFKSRLAVRVALERPAEAFEGGQTERSKAPAENDLGQCGAMAVKKAGSTPPVVPGAAPAWAKAGEWLVLCDVLRDPSLLQAQLPELRVLSIMEPMVAYPWHSVRHPRLRFAAPPGAVVAVGRTGQKETQDHRALGTLLAKELQRTVGRQVLLRPLTSDLLSAVTASPASPHGIGAASGGFLPSSLPDSPVSRCFVVCGVLDLQRLRQRLTMCLREAAEQFCKTPLAKDSPWKGLFCIEVKALVVDSSEYFWSTTDLKTDGTKLLVEKNLVFTEKGELPARQHWQENSATREAFWAPETVPEEVRRTLAKELRSQGPPEGYSFDGNRYINQEDYRSQKDHPLLASRLSQLAEEQNSAEQHRRRRAREILASPPFARPMSPPRPPSGRCTGKQQPRQGLVWKETMAARHCMTVAACAAAALNAASWPFFGVGACSSSFDRNGRNGTRFEARRVHRQIAEEVSGGLGCSDLLGVLRAFGEWHALPKDERRRGAAAWHLRSSALEETRKVGKVGPPGRLQLLDLLDENHRSRPVALGAANGDLAPLLVGLLVASFPQIAVAIPKETLSSSMGTGPVMSELFVDHKGSWVPVQVHPSSISSKEKIFGTPFVLYEELTETSRLYLRCITCVPPLTLLLFANLLSEMAMEQMQRSCLGDEELLQLGMLKVLVPTKAADEILEIRSHLEKLIVSGVRGVSEVLDALMEVLRQPMDMVPFVAQEWSHEGTLQAMVLGPFQEKAEKEVEEEAEEKEEEEKDPKDLKAKDPKAKDGKDGKKK
eukprot:s465_g29.t1